MDLPNGKDETIVDDSNPLLPPRTSGLIGAYLDYSKDLPTPFVYRLWTAIHAVGAAVERRVWTQLQTNKLYPNLFVFLVGPPGTGKSQAINPMTDMLRLSQAVSIAPNDMTKQSLLDCLSECAKGAIINGRPFDYHFMSICISELSNFMSKYDDALTGILTDLFDCPALNEEKKRTNDSGKAIVSPGLSFIMGSATQNLGNTISADMWGSGFMARVIMVFSALDVVPKDMFADAVSNDKLRDEIVLGLRRLGDLKGGMVWDPAARVLITEFRLKQKEGAPLHNRLTFYVTRRWLHLAKLCMVSALSEERQIVNGADFLQAKFWLESAEKDMPEIFKDMISHEDGAVFDELHAAMFAMHMQAHKPIGAEVMTRFLMGKVSAYQIPRMLELAVSAGMFNRVAGTSGDDALYIPQMPMGLRNAGRL